MQSSSGSQQCLSMSQVCLQGGTLALCFFYPDEVSAKSGALWVFKTTSAVRGLGGAITQTQGIVYFECLQFTMGGAFRKPHLKILVPPRAVRLLFGMPTMHNFMALISLFFEDEKEMVRLLYVKQLLLNMRLDPIVVVSTCDGMASPSVV